MHRHVEFRDRGPWRTVGIINEFNIFCGASDNGLPRSLKIHKQAPVDQ